MKVMRLIVSLMMFWVPLTVFGQGKKILSRHFEKYGQDIWSQINTFELIGKQVDENYKAFPLTIKIKDNNKIHVATNSGVSLNISVLNRNVFWSTASDGQDQLLEKQILDHVLTIGSPLAKYVEELEFMGLDDLKGNTYNTFLRANQQIEVKYLLDKENDELRHIRITLLDHEQLEATVTFQKYKSQNGLHIPTAIEISIGDEFKEWILGEILLGTAIDDKLFVKPNGQ